MSVSRYVGAAPKTRNAASKHATVVGIWAGVAAVAGSSGPPIGGLLVEVNWRWIFLINVPIGLAALLTAGGLRTHALGDARGAQWTKVIFNAATSPLAALTGLPMGPLCTDAGLRQQVDDLVGEALAVCERTGITLLRDPQEAVAEAIAKAYHHKPSMLQDVLARRATEIGVLNGGIAAEGRRAGLHVYGVQQADGEEGGDHR